MALSFHKEDNGDFDYQKAGYYGNIGIGVVYGHKDKLLPFQLQVYGDSVLTSIDLVQIDDAGEVCETTALSISLLEHDTTNDLIISTGLALSPTLADGLYYLKIYDGITYYYSEPFRVQDSIFTFDGS